MGKYRDFIACWKAGADPENENGYLSMSLIDSEGRVTDVIQQGQYIYPMIPYQATREHV